MLLVVVTVAFLGLFVVPTSSLRTTSSSITTDATTASTTTTTPAFTLLVTLVFTDSSYKEIFLKDIAPVADYVQHHEPRTIGYQVLVSDQNPLQVTILERYATKEVDYLQTHKSSKPFLEFRPKLQALQEQGVVTMSGHSYYDSTIGFVGAERQIETK